MGFWCPYSCNDGQPSSHERQQPGGLERLPQTPLRAPVLVLPSDFFLPKPLYLFSKLFVQASGLDSGTFSYLHSGRTILFGYIPMEASPCWAFWSEEDISLHPPNGFASNMEVGNRQRVVV